MASTGNGNTGNSTGNGNTGNSTGQSAASAQAAAAASNAAASNAANGNSGNTSNTSGDGKGNAGSTNTSTGATNPAGLIGSLMSFGNNITGNVGNTYGGGSGSDSISDDGKSDALARALRVDRIAHTIQNIFTSAEKARGRMPSYIAEAGDKAYTKARAMGKSEAEAQAIARNTVDRALSADTPLSSRVSSFISLADGKGVRNADAAAFEGRNTGPTYNPSVTAKANTNPNIAAGSSKMGPSAPATAPTVNNAPTNISGETGGIAGSASTESASTAPSVNDAANTGITNRGGTVANGGGTSVTDSGTGGSISSSVTPPSRDASSIGLGVYNNDRANYDQDNWNRGMEVESSSLVSDEECKAFAKRAFMENSEPFKRVRISILKKC